MTETPTDIVAAMRAILRYFEPRCSDKGTLSQLIELTESEYSSENARSVFAQIRQKTLRAENENNRLVLSQYLFEEICAKTLYNLKRAPAPYDPDTAFWILPQAIDFGRMIGITDPVEISELLRM